MKLRFAPSPTGYLHVGGARTAIFNLLHARRHGGVFVLRVEDTDVERSKQHHAEQILSSLAWLGIEWDEGPVFQSERLDRYRERAEWLVSERKAYRCDCAPEQIEQERRHAEAEGVGYRYSGRCRDREVERSSSHVIRLRVDPRQIRFHDLVRDDVEFDAAVLDDFVLLRSDRSPTYHLSVVVDDIDMEVTIVARGDDHLSNTPKHILLFEALGAAVPSFAHLPLILGADRKRLSKRTGSTSVEDYQQMGILPQALFNFLFLLGWSPGGDREIATEQEAATLFDLADVNKAAAVFDVEKLLWLNGQYIQSMPPERLEPHLRTFLPEEVPNDERLRKLIELHQPRARTLREMAEQLVAYFSDDRSLHYEGEAVRKHLKGDDLEHRLSLVRSVIGDTEPFDAVSLETSLRDAASAGGTSAAKLIHPLRLALTGRAASPGIFDVVLVLGREQCLSRIDHLLENLEAVQSGAQVSSSSTDQ